MREVLHHEKGANDEAAIRCRLDDHVKALCAMNLDTVMSVYASDIVSFDLEPPLKYTGLDSKRGLWAKVFSMIVPPLRYEIRDLASTAGNAVAFSHSINRMNATLKTGQSIDCQVRWTACFRKIGDAWLIVYEQVSVPVDFRSGRAIFDLSAD